MLGDRPSPAELAARLADYYLAARLVFQNNDEEIIAHMIALEQNELLDRIATTLATWLGIHE